MTGTQNEPRAQARGFLWYIIDMHTRFHRRINAVRQRQRIQQTLNYAAWGLLLAAPVVLISPTIAGTILLASIILGVIQSHSATRAAKLIDKHYNLKDRVLTTTAPC